MTYSIVAFDPETGDLGVAVQSKFPCVGAIVPWVEIEVGAIATQAEANLLYGSEGISLLRKNFQAEEVLSKLLEADPRHQVRQVGIIDSQGNATAFTGSDCFEWAGHIVGENYTCQGNILVSEETVRGMSRAFENTSGDLLNKLLAALKAGQIAGGDRRGQQSAALIVRKKNGGYGGVTDRYVNIRVDDHPNPIEELDRIFKIWDITLLSREDPSDLLKLEGDVAQEVVEILVGLGYLSKTTKFFNDVTQAAFENYMSFQNFENKMQKDHIWKSVLEFMQLQWATKQVPKEP